MEGHARIGSRKRRSAFQLTWIVGSLLVVGLAQAGTSASAWPRSTPDRTWVAVQQPAAQLSGAGRASTRSQSATSGSGATPDITWRRLSIPPPVGGSITQMSYDPVRDELVALSQAADSTNLFTSTFSLSSSQVWRSPLSAQFSNFQPVGMIYDPTEAGVILVGEQSGRLGSMPTFETLKWAGSQWTMIASGGVQGNPLAASLAYDPVQGELVLYGGSPHPGTAGNQPYGETYMFKSGAWLLDHPSDTSQDAGPIARDYAAMTADPRSGRMLMFGGYTNGILGNDTWLLDTSRQRLLPPNSVFPTQPPGTLPNGKPSPRPGPSPQPSNTDWAPAKPDTQPPPGSYWAQTDPVYGFAFLSGMSGGSWQDWRWGGSTWTQMSESSTKPNLEYATATMDNVHHRLLVGGTDVADAFAPYQLWEGDLATPQLLGIGDSITSGEGVPPFDNGTNGGNNYCHRSQAAYLTVAAQKLGLPSLNLACSGATIPNLTSDTHVEQWSDPNTGCSATPPGYCTTLPWAEIKPPDWMSMPQPKNVILTIGANDAHFTRILTACIAPIFGGDCSDSQAVVAEPVYITSEIQPQLATAYKVVADAFPTSHIYVMGYPNIFTHPWEFAEVPTTCEYISPKDITTLMKLTTLMDQAISNAVGQAASTQSAKGQNSAISYVNDKYALSGHELCGGDQWVNGVDSLAGMTYGNIGAFHPNAQGQAALARCLEDAIQGQGNCNGPPPKAPGQLPSSPCYPLCYMSIGASPPGAKIALAAGGFAPGSTVTASWHSEVVVLKKVTADSSGIVKLVVAPPENTSLGAHTIVMTGRQEGGGTLVVRAPITVIRRIGFPTGNALPHHTASKSGLKWPVLGLLFLVLSFFSVMAIYRSRDRMNRNRVG